MIELTVVDDEVELARTGAARIRAAIDGARAERGAAHVALAGGRTPADAYRRLGELVHDWHDVHVWFGDERCVPLDDPQSNHALVADTLLSAPLDPAPHVHPMAYAGADAAATAAGYERELRHALPGNPPRLDLALLGIGEDGHTASLFAGDPALTEHERLCVPAHGVKPPFARVTLTLPMLLASRQILMLAQGAGKAWAVHATLAGIDPRVPASLLANGDVELIADRAAAPS